MIVWVQHWLPANPGLLRRALPLALAAWLSFTLAVLLHVENAYWAAMPVWVVTQTTRELLLGRAAYRIIGSLVGAMLGLAILHLPVPMTGQLALAAVVIGMGAGLCHLLPGVRAYGTLMVAVTTAVVIVPSALSTDASLHLALERISCTLIGVIVTTLVMALCTPPSARQHFYESVRQLSADAIAMAGQVVARAASDDGSERRILAEIAELEARASLVSASSRDAGLRQRHVGALVVATVEVMAAAYALAAQIQRGFAAPDTLPSRLADLSAALRQGTPGSRVLRPNGGTPLGHPVLDRFLGAVGQLILAEQRLYSPADPPPGDVREPNNLPVQRDWTSAWQAAITAGLVALLSTCAVHVTGSALFVPMAMAVCIFSIVLGSLPLPQQIAPTLFTGVCTGVLAAIVYRLWLQPALSTPLLLVLSILPFILAGAFARAYPRTSLASIDANMCFMLVSQAGRPAVGSGIILGEGFTMLLGAALVAGGFMLLPRLPHRRAIAAARGIQRDLERLLALPPAAASQQQWRSKTYRQILRLTVHMTRAGRLGDEVPRSLLAALNLGHAVALLQGKASTGNEQAIRALRAMRAFATKPSAVANVLLNLADRTEELELIMALHMTADALSRCEGLLALGNRSPRNSS